MLCSIRFLCENWGKASRNSSLVALSQIQIEEQTHTYVHMLPLIWTLSFDYGQSHYIWSLLVHADNDSCLCGIIRVSQELPACPFFSGRAGLCRTADGKKRNERSRNSPLSACLWAGNVARGGWPDNLRFMVGIGRRLFSSMIFLSKDFQEPSPIHKNTTIH